MMTEDIRDIKGIIGIFDLGTFIFFVAVFIILLAFVYCAYRYYQKVVRSRKPQKIAAAPPKPFNQIAEEAINALDPADYFQKGLFRDYYFELTALVRRFLAGNYKIDALEKTSYELIEEMERVERDYEKIKLLDQFFQTADLVKFAKDRPSLAIMREAKNKALLFIKEFYRAIR
jgi:hypothetical protein